MKLFFLGKKITVVIFLACFIGFFSTCISKQDKPVITNNKGESFAGSEKCASCHKEIYENFMHTAHNITSREASAKTIKGSFAKGENVFNYSYYTGVAMEKTDSGFYQVQFNRSKEKERRRIDVVIGSGTRGQSFATWQGNKLFQLPVSYFTYTNKWANSPGYTNFSPDFRRVVTIRCMECHSTYVKKLSASKSPNEFDKTRVIFGVQCESCHGPAQKHIEYHENNPAQKKGKYIIAPEQFSRAQKLDLCSYCHGGNRETNKAAFEFTPGDTLPAALLVNSFSTTNNALDVHGNPYGLLIASKCFKMSTSLTCSSCHNTHQQERGNLELFSKRCMNCHSERKDNFCKMTELPVAVMKTNCIDCHMPKKKSESLTLELEDNSNSAAAVLRSHLIAVYPANSKKYISEVDGKH
jgi:hypothetical protein